MNFKDIIREVPGFPKPEILFYDITTLLMNPEAFKNVIDEMVSKFENKGIKKVVGIESRGFIFGSVIAVRLNAGFIPARKRGKLPYKTIEESYSLEYGNDYLQIHADAITEGENVLIVDDLLATGGTLKATTKLVEKLKGNIKGIAVVIELLELKGREKLNGFDVISLVQY